MTQFVGAIWYLLAMTFATTYWGDAATHVNVCRGAALAWAGCAMIYGSGALTGSLKFTEATVMSLLLPFFFAYLGFCA